MSVPSSVEELLGLIRKSGMIEDQALNSYLQRRELGRGLPNDPREATDCMIRDGLITNFQAEQFLLGKWRGFTIGKFKLLERIGVGGMGQVFLCEHMFMKRRVAIKVLPPAKAEQPAALGRFYREARAAGSIEHPNIVRTHDIDQDGNLHFIVMEYVDGTNLLDVVKKYGPLNIKRATSYIRQVAVGLDFAFRAGLVHRDIKPGNVLIDRKGLAKLLDMGLARFYKDQSDNLTVKYDDKIVLGTADYVAPEQVANSHSVDIRADIYALGASFYFLLAGHPPFPNGTVSQKLLWHRTKEPTPIRSIRPEVPEGLANIIAKMMAKDPVKRQQTPIEVAQELEPWLNGNIPLPAPEEMPVLSPAASEAQATLVHEPDSEMVETPRNRSTSNGDSSHRQAAIPTRATVGAGVGGGGGAFAPASGGKGTATVAKAPEPFRVQSGGNPFAPSAQVDPTSPNSAMQETPRELPRQAIPPSVFREQPFTTEEVPSGVPNTKIILTALLVVVVSVILGLSAAFVLG